MNHHSNSNHEITLNTYVLSPSSSLFATKLVKARSTTRATTPIDDDDSRTNIFPQSSPSLTTSTAAQTTSDYNGNNMSPASSSNSPSPSTTSTSIIQRPRSMFDLSGLEHVNAIKPSTSVYPSPLETVMAALRSPLPLTDSISRIRKEANLTTASATTATGTGRRYKPKSQTAIIPSLVQSQKWKLKKETSKTLQQTSMKTTKNTTATDPDGYRRLQRPKSASTPARFKRLAPPATALAQNPTTKMTPADKSISKKSTAKGGAQRPRTITAVNDTSVSKTSSGPTIDWELLLSNDDLESLGPFRNSNLHFRRNELMVQIWTDFGQTSKVGIISVGCGIIDHNYTGPIRVKKDSTHMQNSLTETEFLEWCYQLNTTIGVRNSHDPPPESIQNDYHLMWSLYILFDGTLKHRIANYGEASLIAMFGPSRKSLDNRVKRSIQTTSIVDSLKHIKRILTHLNEKIWLILSNANPIRKFILAYGRYIELGYINTCIIMKTNHLNDKIRKSYEAYSGRIEPTYNVLSYPAFEVMVNPNYGSRRKMIEVPAIPPSKKQSSSGGGGGKTTAKSKINTNTSDKGSSNSSNNNISGVVGRSATACAAKTSSTTTTYTTVGGPKKFTLNKQPSNSSSTNIPSSSKSSTTPSGNQKAKKKSKDINNNNNNSSNDGQNDKDKKDSTNGTSSSSKPKKKVLSQRNACIEHCKYDFIKELALDRNYILVDHDERWNLMWSDAKISLTDCSTIRRSQDGHIIFSSRLNPPLHKVNHFPGMSIIARKDGMALTMSRMTKTFGIDYNFIPKTWITPMEINSLLHYIKHHPRASFICKPNNGSQGRGISIITNCNNLCPFASATYQTYITNPFLIDDYKFDLRIYVLVTSIDPLIIYIYPDGMARFATVKYQKPAENNITELKMHLTNYSLNKDSTIEGMKRKLSDIYKIMKEAGHDIEAVSNSIDDAVIKTLIGAQPSLKQHYESIFPKGSIYGSICFELLGFDILLDENLKAYVLEVNRAPSFTMDKLVDIEVKEPLLNATFDKIYLGAKSDRANKATLKKSKQSLPSLHDFEFLRVGSEITIGLERQFLHESLNGTKYRRIYPLESNYEQYNKFYLQPTSQSSSSTNDNNNNNIKPSINELKTKLYPKYNNNELFSLNQDLFDDEVDGAGGGKQEEEIYDSDYYFRRNLYMLDHFLIPDPKSVAAVSDIEDEEDLVGVGRKVKKTSHKPKIIKPRCTKLGAARVPTPPSTASVSSIKTRLSKFNQMSKLPSTPMRGITPGRPNYTCITPLTPNVSTGPGGAKTKAKPTVVKKQQLSSSKKSS